MSTEGRAGRVCPLLRLFWVFCARVLGPQSRSRCYTHTCGAWHVFASAVSKWAAALPIPKHMLHCMPETWAGGPPLPRAHAAVSASPSAGYAPPDQGNNPDCKEPSSNLSQACKQPCRTFHVHPPLQPAVTAPSSFRTP